MSEALIFASINPQYDKRMFMERENCKHRTWAEHGQNMFCSCSALVFFMVIPWKSVIILWVNWCKNKSFWQRFSCIKHIFLVYFHSKCNWYTLWLYCTCIKKTYYMVVLKMIKWFLCKKLFVSIMFFLARSITQYGMKSFLKSLKIKSIFYVYALFLDISSSLWFTQTRKKLESRNTKGGFFSETAIHFSNLQNKNVPNYYPELEIWISCLLLLAGNLDFQFRIVI